jgi:hypothetical protein
MSYPQGSVLGLNGSDLVLNHFQDALRDRLKARTNLFVGERHVPLIYPCFWKYSFDANIDSPFLAVIAEIGLNSAGEISNTFGVDTTSSSRATGELHRINFSSYELAEVTVQSIRSIVESECVARE